MKKILLLCVVLSCGFFGCGNGNNTSGTLTMSEITSNDLTGGTYNVVATATYAPDAGQDATNSEIDFTAEYSTPSNATATKTKTSKVMLTKTGIATFSDMVVQGSEPVYLRLIASIGGLSQTKMISIPAVAVLSASPAAISFLNTDTVGTAKTATVTGGFSPYTVASTLPTDIRADISGSAVTITKLAAGSTTNTSTTVTITDNKGTTYTILVGYFK